MISISARKHERGRTTSAMKSHWPPLQPYAVPIGPSYIAVLSSLATCVGNAVALPEEYRRGCAHPMYTLHIAKFPLRWKFFESLWGLDHLKLMSNIIISLPRQCAPILWWFNCALVCFDARGELEWDLAADYLCYSTGKRLMAAPLSSLPSCSMRSASVLWEQYQWSHQLRCDQVSWRCIAHSRWIEAWRCRPKWMHLWSPMTAKFLIVQRIRFFLIQQLMPYTGQTWGEILRYLH